MEKKQAGCGCDVKLLNLYLAHSQALWHYEYYQSSLDAYGMFFGNTYFTRECLYESYIES